MQIYRINNTNILPGSIRRLYTTDDTSMEGKLMSKATSRKLCYGVQTDGIPLFWVETDGGPVTACDDPESFANFLFCLADNREARSLVEMVREGFNRFMDAYHAVRKDLFCGDEEVLEALSEWVDGAEAAVVWTMDKEPKPM